MKELEYSYYIEWFNVSVWVHTCQTFSDLIVAAKSLDEMSQQPQWQGGLRLVEIRTKVLATRK